MLGLQVTRGHVGFGLDRLGRIFLPRLQIMFIDNPQRECFEDYLFQFLINDRQVIVGDQFHLFGKREIEEKDPTL